MTNQARITRRQMLAASAGAAACAGLPLFRQRGLAQSSTSAPGAANKLIIVLASGGWDQTYTLDPKLGASGVDAPEGSVQRFGEIPIMVHESRPAVTDFFTRYGERATVING